MITRLRPTYSPEQLAEMYAVPHEHARFEDHVHRVNMTLMAAHGLRQVHDVATVADLSCGDAAIANGIPAGRRYLGDFGQGYEFEGPIEQTIEQVPFVDLFVCCETIEHLDDPAAVLAAIRATAGALLLSTPVGNTDDPNPEHYWSWDRADVENLIREAGFQEILSYDEMDLRPSGFLYAFGIWTAR